MRTNFLRTLQIKSERNQKVKTNPVFLLLILLITPFAKANELPSNPVAKSTSAFSAPAGVAYEPAVTTQKENRTREYFALGSAAECAVGISMSGNHARSAQIGIPVTLTANFLAKKLGPRHPKLSAALQIIAPVSCYSGWNKDATKKALAVTKPTVTTTSDPVVVATGSTGGNSGGSNSGGSSGNGCVTNCSGSGGGGNSGGGTSGGGTGSGGGNNPPPPAHGPCLTDCGIPGNGGLNSGHDTGSKPPFPGQGPKQTPGTGNGAN